MAGQRAAGTRSCFQLLMALGPTPRDFAKAPAPPAALMARSKAPRGTDWEGVVFVMRHDYSVADISATEICMAETLKGFQLQPGLGSCLMSKTPIDLRETQFYEDLAWRLRLAMEALAVPKGDIAKEIGVSQSRLSNWITNQNKPDWFSVARFCQRYGVSADWLLLGDEAGLRKSMVESLASVAGGMGLRTKAAGRSGSERD